MTALSFSLTALDWLPSTWAREAPRRSPCRLLPAMTARVDDQAANPSARAPRIDLDALAAHADAARGGDHAAFRALVALLTPLVFKTALRSLGDPSDAEDAVQETFVRTWRALPRLHDTRAALAFVCTIARAATADAHRARARGARGALPLDDKGRLDVEHRATLDALSRADADPVELLAQSEARALLLAVLEGLPEKHRVVIFLRDIDGLTAEETAAALGIPVGTVDSRLSRARATLTREVKALVDTGRRPLLRLPF